MKVSINNPRVTVPEAFVTKDRQRVKQYGDNVYLKNGDEFEIELFNPTQSKILAKIRLNGKYISDSGIVLRPGERVFLERYLDEAKKFLFETYEVDGNDPNAHRAIRNNGDVEVEFYEEYQLPYTLTYTRYPNYTWYSVQPNYYTNTTFTSGHTDFSSKTTSNTYCCNSNVLNEKSLETGRVEKGDHSNQTFGTDYTVYNSYYSWKSTWKILPVSLKHITKEDINVFCTGCGARRKKTSHKFCPHCGTRF